MFRAACDGEFKEAKERRIEIQAPAADVESIDRILQYLYINKYDDGWDENNNNTTSASPTRGSHNENGDSLDNRPDILRTVGVQESESSGLRPSSLSDTESESRQRQTCTNEVILVLTNNLCVYSCADFYNIPDLKTLAMKKFTDALGLLKGAYSIELAGLIQDVSKDVLVNGLL